MASNIEGLDKKVDRLEMMINEVHGNGPENGPKKNRPADRLGNRYNCSSCRNSWMASDNLRSRVTEKASRLLNKIADELLNSNP